MKTGGKRFLGLGSNIQAINIYRNRFYIDPDLDGKHEVIINADKFQLAQARLKKSILQYNVLISIKKM